MDMKAKIYHLRTQANLSQAALAEILQVSHQAVQKWESGRAIPELDKIIRMAKYFGVSMDALVLDRDERMYEIAALDKKLSPNFAEMHEWNLYSSFLSLTTEYKQSTEEGLDMAEYADLFRVVAKMPNSEAKEKIADVLFDILQNAEPAADYSYTEPSDLMKIRELRRPYAFAESRPDDKTLADKIHGAWVGRACGCLLGKPVEGQRTETLVPLLRSSGNYPMHRYIHSDDITEEVMEYSLLRKDGCYVDRVDGMPVDDDTNYTVMAQEIVSQYGRDFTPLDVAKTWLTSQMQYAYCTAERVAFRNFVNGYEPPQSARYKNPYREWIGAQIRGDYFGYINPGDPEAAAEMAFRDACISHVKNGIYGEMFVAAMIACAAVTDSIPAVIRGGLAQIPATSRLYEAVVSILNDYENHLSQEACFDRIHTLYDEHDMHDWCHTVSNAMIVTASLLYSEGDFGKSICLSVQTGFDTDCNGATVGSILGMRGGLGSIGKEWTAPLRDTLHTSLFGVGTVSLAERAALTLRHLPRAKAQ